MTKAESVEIEVPRDRESSFEPVIVDKRRRLSGIDNLVFSLSTKGLTHGEVSVHLAEIYGAEVSKQAIFAGACSMAHAAGRLSGERVSELHSLEICPVALFATPAEINQNALE